MNIKTLVAAAAALAVVACSGEESDSNDNNSDSTTSSTSSDSSSGGSSGGMFPYAEGTLVYDMTGMQTGTQTTYFRDYGREMVQVTEVSTKIPGMTDEQMAQMGVGGNQTTITKTDADWIYTVDVTNNAGTKMPNPMKSLWGDGAADPVEFGKQMMKQMGGKQTGSDTFNGTDCEKWQLPMGAGTTCISDEGIMQYTRVNMMGMEQNTELVSAEFGGVDSSKFDLPDIEYTEMPDMSDMLKGLGGQ